MITKKNCVLLCFSHSFAHNILFLMKAIFIQGAFQHIQGLLWKIWRLFKNIPQFFNFQGLFKDFSRPLWTMVSQFWMALNVYSNRFRFVKCSNCAIILLGHFDGIVPSLVYSEETTWHPRWKIPQENLWKHHFKMSLQYMPGPSRTCAFGASSKATYYSLSACYLKTFWQPSLMDGDLSMG